MVGFFCMLYPSRSFHCLITQTWLRQRCTVAVPLKFHHAHPSCQAHVAASSVSPTIHSNQLGVCWKLSLKMKKQYREWLWGQAMLKTLACTKRMKTHAQIRPQQLVQRAGGSEVLPNQLEEVKLTWLKWPLNVLVKSSELRRETQLAGEINLFIRVPTSHHKPWI